MKKVGVGVQMWTFHEKGGDLRQILEGVAKIGFGFVEFAGKPDRLTAEEVRDILDNLGLRARSAHVDITALEMNFADDTEYWGTIGINQLVAPMMMDECRDSVQAWRQGIQRLNTLAAQLADLGMTTGFHTHPEDFLFFPGCDQSRFQLILQETDPRVGIQLDTAWVQVGLSSVTRLISDYGQRCHSIHFKEVAVNPEGRPHRFVKLDEGGTSWESIIAAIKQSSKIDCIYFEQDECYGDPYRYATAAYEFLTKSGFGN